MVSISILEVVRQKRFGPASKDIAEAPPEYGVKRFLFLLSTHFWKLAALNLLFVAFCVPVVTIPAALCGMNRVLIKLVRDGNCFLWSDFIKEFKSNLFKGMPFGIAYAFMVFDGYYFLSMARDDGVNILLAAVGFLLIGFAVLFSSYAFVLLPTLSLKNRHIAKNALIMTISEWKTNIVILGGVFVMVFITVMFFPYTVILLPTIGFSLLQLIVCVAINQSVQKLIIGPYEQSQRKDCNHG